jgi:riboflavin biosynthesis pyrimidine reductase
MDAVTFSARVREIYGEDLLGEAGVVHVTSVWEAPDGAWRSLRISPTSPRSVTDAFVLALGRARSDAIVTTGAILRAEPALRHTLPDAASAWRAGTLAKSHSPTTVVLTRRADLDLTHPLFAASSAPVVVVTGDDTAAELRDRVAAHGSSHRVEVVGRAQPSLRDVVQWLKAQRACRTVLVEAGPSTSRTLYDDPFVVDELMLSIYDALDLAPAARGEVFARPDDPLRVCLASAEEGTPEFTSQEEIGRWRFRRVRLAAVRRGR